MRQRHLGTSGLMVGEIGLGGMPMSIKQDRPSESEAIKVIVRATELGMTLWDTADAYCRDHSEIGHNEQLFAKAHAALPDDLRESVVIATKAGLVRPEGRWECNGHPDHLRSALEASLKALNTDSIQLWQFHRPDPEVPFEDSVGVFAQAVEDGKVQHVGLSNVSAEQIEIAMKMVPITSVQNRYSPGHREPESDGTLDKCRALELAFLPWSPLGGMGDAKKLGERDVLEEIARELETSPQCVVLAWHLAKYEDMLPIPGASQISSVEDSARASEIVLTAARMDMLDKAFA